MSISRNGKLNFDAKLFYGELEIFFANSCLVPTDGNKNGVEDACYFMIKNKDGKILDMSTWSGIRITPEAFATDDEKKKAAMPGKKEIEDMAKYAENLAVEHSKHQPRF